MGRLSKLETGMLWVARGNVRARQTARSDDEYDATMDEILEEYFGITFKSGFVKVGDTYVEQSTPPGSLATDRYSRAEMAVWYAVSRLDENGLIQSSWHFHGTAFSMTGANLTDAGAEQAAHIPDVIPTKKRWGQVVDPSTLHRSRSQHSELERAILRMSLEKRRNGEWKEKYGADLLEWEVLHEYYGFAFEQSWSQDSSSHAVVPGSFADDVKNSEEYLSARQAIYGACRNLDYRGLIEMGGPGALASTDWGDLLRGSGLNKDQRTEAVSSLFPSGFWDTARLTTKGIEAASR